MAKGKLPRITDQNIQPHRQDDMHQDEDLKRIIGRTAFASQYRPLAEEKAASWLSKHFTCWYLEENGFGRVLQEGAL